MKTDSLIDEIEGQVCWSAWLGHGSVFFLEFGSPSVYVHDRVTSSGRLACVEGEWHICVQYSSWRLKLGDELVAHSESGRLRIERGLSRLRGQVFLGVERARGAHVLEFDLGARIEIRPYRDIVVWPIESTEMWYARRRGEWSQSWLADGTQQVARDQPPSRTDG